MEFEEGFKATDMDSIEKAGLNKQYVMKSCIATCLQHLPLNAPDSHSFDSTYSDIAKLIASVFNEQVFLEGFVHCDPHPANLMVRKQNGGPFLVLLDHGLYKQLDDDFRIQYAHLWRSLMKADVKGIKESCKVLGVDEMVSARV